MPDMIQSTEGLIHFIAGVLALITGTLVLSMKKGTKLHIRIGYIYVISMLVLLISSFMIYRLFNGWGIFHYASIISAFSLLVGIIPAIFLRHKSFWLRLHFTGMFWSVIGLWAAFVAEMSVRVPESSFMWMVGVAFGVVMLIGVIIFSFYKPKWISWTKYY
ncbi:DUF2306 domain-containing protein [Marivirga sp.]|uniref:DUF2306 domain-containing protein n=1 Tax=Marivirga sp. TaxID=2018662 RepID=UPI003DA754E7